MDIKNGKLKVKSFTIDVDPKDKFLEMDKTFSVASLVDVVEVKYPSNQDGTVDKVWVGKSTGESVVSDKYKKTIYQKKKGSQSQRWFRFVGGQNGSKMDDRDYYEYVMNIMNANQDEVLKYILKIGGAE